MVNFILHSIHSAHHSVRDGRQQQPHNKMEEFLLLSLSCYECCTLRASDWLIFSTSHVKVRPYTALAKASRAASACSKFSGVIICINIKTAQWKMPKCTSNNWKPEEWWRKDDDLLSLGCEFLVSECLPKGWAIDTQQLENNNTSALSQAVL